MKKKTNTPKSPVTNILFCGTGGQGVLAAAEICGLAALNEGFHVKKSEVHGMAQRGGSVESHLRFGPHVYSPLIPHGQVDYLVSFLKEESLRMHNLLSKHGVDLTPELDRGLAAISDKRLLNSFLLGVLSGHLAISQDSWLKAIEQVFAKKNLQGNIDAFLHGRGGSK
ncbi:MAG: indolepyruvate oxidoreductase subunit beta [Candidatus Omnitrophica bacterium]|nr:indolepyruvate oxidoreductase subunit beta [Candidatus Omnitrophota bacterium]